MMLWTIIYILHFASGADALKILVWHPTTCFSHQRPSLALTERLLKEGHELFVISPNALPAVCGSDNYTYIDVSHSYNHVSDKDQNEGFFYQQQMSKWKHAELFPKYANLAREQLMGQSVSAFKRRVESQKIKFDVVLIEATYHPFICALAQHLSGTAPVITISSLAIDFFNEEHLGSVSHLSYVPSIFSHYTDRMSVWEKLENWFSHSYLIEALRHEMEIAAKKFLRENNYYGSRSDQATFDCPNISLSLITSNPMYFYPRMLGPNVIETGPLHLKTPDKLPKMLQNWLDGAEKGVIYFSLGSLMKSKALSEDVRSNFLQFFRQLAPGYRVLWKWESDKQILGQSSNILTQKWMPQESVLAHPKVRLFITQGGLQSFQEAVHFGVPMVGIPHFADQESTTSKMVDSKIGVQLFPQELHSYKKIKAALETVLYDESYARNMKRHSIISHDFTTQALDKAVFWIQHVARHGGASHLKPATARTTLLQYFCLDIITVILLFSSMILLIIHRTCKFLISMINEEPKLKVKKP